MPRAKYRTTVAHELVHTLFYSTKGAIPNRILDSSDAEERFCFDVGRRILAPEWHIRALGLPDLTEAVAKFDKLTGTLQLSRPVAARVLLEDYCLARGIAGEWELSDGTWRLRKGKSFASPALKEAERKPLREMARDLLQHGRHAGPEFSVAVYHNRTDNSAFVLVTKL